MKDLYLTMRIAGNGTWQIDRNWNGSAHYMTNAIPVHRKLHPLQPEHWNRAYDGLTIDLNVVRSDLNLPRDVIKPSRDCDGGDTRGLWRRRERPPHRAEIVWTVWDGMFYCSSWSRWVLLIRRQIQPGIKMWGVLGEYWHRWVIWRIVRSVRG